MARGFFRSLALVALMAVLLAVPATAAARPHAGKGPVRMNELQVIGTHNSYKRELSRAEEAEYDEIVKRPGDYQEFLAYSHTLAGADRNGRLILVAVEGRRPGSSVGASFEESARIIRALGARHAVNLDGGGSTGMTLGSSLVTRPSDLTGERPIADALVIDR